MDAPIAISITNVINETLELPDLVICPTRGINASKLIQDRMPSHLVDIVMSGFGVDMKWVYISSIANTNSSIWDSAESENDFNKWMEMHNFKDFKELVEHYRYQPTEFIHSLYLSQEQLDYGGSITNDNFSIMIGYASGICFTYTTNKNVSWPGLAGGYQIILQLPQAKLFDNSYTDGWHIGIVKPLAAAPTSYLKIPGNSAVDIEIFRTEVSRLSSYSWPKTGTLCKNSPHYKTSDSCANQVFAQTVKAVCNCTYMQSPSAKLTANDSRVCNPIQMVRCANTPATTEQSNSILRQSKCLPVCNEIEFQRTMSHGRINRDKILSSLGIPSTTVRRNGR